MDTHSVTFYWQTSVLISWRGRTGIRLPVCVSAASFLSVLICLMYVTVNMPMYVHYITCMCAYWE